MAEYRRPAHRDAFEIAILCALNVEVSAVENLFDEDWEKERSYSRANGDANSYKIGRIANCNVVLAYIPEMGINSAAKTAIWLKASFTNVHLALLVGICGGTPKSTEGEDIFLGDVVISTGIVQYDLGRLYPHSFSTKNGAENKLPGPPPRLRSFLAKLQAAETRRQLAENTYQNLRHISLTQAIAFPGARQDILHQPSYRHKHQRLEDCEICAKCSSENDAVCDEALKATCSTLRCNDAYTVIRDRSARAGSAREQLSKAGIHFGKMASGNVIMRSSAHRDRIASSDGIIAFEMEGAAIWEELPTIIVKSVCDYADSHKDKAWQKYAAYVAAACVKAVISESRTSRESQLFQPIIRGPSEFAIPPSDLDAATNSKTLGAPSFWSYKLYRDIAENTVSVHYCTDIDSSEEMARTLVNEPVLGFGMHWLEPSATIIPNGETGIDIDNPYNISLIVLAKEDSIYVFQISAHAGETTEEKIAPTLKEILESPNTLKAGVLVFNFKDVRLLSRFDIRLKGIFELADLDRILETENSQDLGYKPLKQYTPINDLVEEHLHLDHYRAKNMRCSNWTRQPLHEAQLEYVANDGYAGYQLFRTMNAKRLRMRPVPPLPLPAEEQSVEQIKEKEMYMPSFIQKRRAQAAMEVSSSTPQSSSSRAPGSQEHPLEVESPNKKRKGNRDGDIRQSLYPDILEPGGKFIWLDGKPVFNFGKHITKSIQDVAFTNRSYLGWLTNPQNNFSTHVVKIARDALNGVFPTKPIQQIPYRPVE